MGKRSCSEGLELMALSHFVHDADASRQGKPRRAVSGDVCRNCPLPSLFPGPLTRKKNIGQPLTESFKPGFATKQSRVTRPGGLARDWIEPVLNWLLNDVPVAG